LVHRHEANFPFDIEEAPDVIQSFDCKLEKGTSGSPMFAPGSEEVQAVQMGMADIAKLAVKVATENKRPLRNYEKHQASIAANVRCLDLPGTTPISCTKVVDDEIVRRFAAYQMSEMDKLNKRTFADSRAEVQFKPYRYQFKNDIQQFEIVHLPHCRMKDAPLSSAPIGVEHVQLSFNEWAELKPEILRSQTVVAKAKPLHGSIYELRTSWPSPAGEYNQPDLDLRKKFGDVFRIDLPLCPR
jgi:hypothetical protein